MASSLYLTGLTKRYGSRAVVDTIDIEIEGGKFYSFLGPSGCGKTTSLRMIAGLERPDAGIIRLGDTVLSDASRGVFLEPERRGMGMVFQSYAVWPHMTVGGNVEFPLKLRGVSSRERDRRVDEVLDMVGLGQYRHRPATDLSGGQQQRVAIARALVYRPEVLLLDEPLSNLDARLREQMRTELRQIQQQLGTTTIMVTHDQLEAMVVSDRIVVMRDGLIEQIGAPEAVYFEPDTPFVMDFLGCISRISAKVIGPDGHLCLAGNAAVEFQVPPGIVPSGVQRGDDVALCLRQEHIRLLPGDDHQPGDWPARVCSATFLGASIEYVVDVAGSLMRVEASPQCRFIEGQPITVRANLEMAKVWPAEMAAG